MNTTLMIDPQVCYQQAEQKAADYFKTLYTQAMQKTYVDHLTKDFHTWKQNHIHHYPVFSLFSQRKGKPETNNYHHYIKWLNYKGKLESYLDRSISYLYMRDLGKDLRDQSTRDKVTQVVQRLKKNLTNEDETKTEVFDIAWLYRWGQKEAIESTIIWLLEKLKKVSDNLPKGMDAEHAQRKLMKIIAGVVMHVDDELDEDTPPVERSRRLDEAIRLGYSYGLTYPFVDDLLDSNILSNNEKKQYSNLIEKALLTGEVSDFGPWSGSNMTLISFIHSELSEAFKFIKSYHQPDTRKLFFEQAYVFFRSQELDREKDLRNPNYTNEELFIPVILKSASSRLIARSVMDAPEDQGFDARTFFYGIYNQLADDFADMFDDLEEGAVTPYTYYMKYHTIRPDLINPFELYWAVISHLIHDVYNSDRKTCEVMLDRAINGLKRYKEKMGADKYNEVMKLFSSKMGGFNELIQKLVRKADDVDFFDKLLRDQMISNLKNDRKEQDQFKETVEQVRVKINSNLKINQMVNAVDPIVKAANYSLDGDGKRLRPIMTWVMGVNGYGLDESTIIPLLRSLEYMHTASLIFDDLPSQDNAAFRRGRPTLHQVFNSATAELTGLFLTQKAIEEQASITHFDAKTVLGLIQYSAMVTEEMCKGQTMDLNSKGKALTVEELNTLCFYKTGMAFEASLIMPAILANANAAEMDSLKKFARHAGIAFQIKDDLLDVEGELSVLGKLPGKDAENKNSTFVTILGIE
ncbi:polyprenyl synthetase family protein, partial [Bacillus sp. JJ1764]|uniref:polyprenyl synthetase family protein n=1 Tax=Bacillus sp. JJ1764 TaxID=3122964 RepID=UPI002FFD8D9E